MNSVRSNLCLIRTDLVELGSFGSIEQGKLWRRAKYLTICKCINYLKKQNQF